MRISSSCAGSQGCQGTPFLDHKGAVMLQLPPQKNTRTIAKEFYSTHPTQIPVAAVSPLCGPNRAMYSFDFAQQVCNTVCNIPEEDSSQLD